MTNDSDPITLKDAAGNAGLSECALRYEADRGRLELFKIGSKYYTTRQSVADLDRCWYAKRNAAPQGSGIYVVGFDSYVKIGWSDDLPRRLQALQNALPVKLNIYATYSCQKVNERILHRRFRKHRSRGEWFRLEADVAEWVKRRCPL